MKNIILLGCCLFSFTLISQTIISSDFSEVKNQSHLVKIADNSSFNMGLIGITGTGVTWDASGLTPMGGYPTFNFSYKLPSNTPRGALFPYSDAAFSGYAFPTLVGVEYYDFSTDSFVLWGSYSPSTQHEIFQDPDKKMIFPFNYGQSFTDNYTKTNYSDSVTVSSIQNGTRTVQYIGYGTLVLPQGSFTNVALIYELRTNSLGPNSTEYTWYKISNGKRLLLRSENNGDILTAYSSDIASNTNERVLDSDIYFYPNPIDDYAVVKVKQSTDKKYNLAIYNIVGEKVSEIEINKSETIINRNSLPSGIYIYTLSSIDREIVKSGKLIFK